MRSSNSRVGGFTLIEVIVVIAVITLLAGVVVPMVSGVSTQGKAAKILAVTDTLKKACARYYADTGLTALEYSGTSYNTATHHRLSMTQTTAGWRGPYIDHPLSYADNPMGSYVYVYNSFASAVGTGFDLTGAGSNTATGTGNFVRFGGITEEIGQMVDDSLDKSIGGDWKSTGQVKWASNSLYIFLLDA